MKIIMKNEYQKNPGNSGIFCIYPYNGKQIMTIGRVAGLYFFRDRYGLSGAGIRRLF